MEYSNVAMAFVLLVAGALVAGSMRSWRTAGWTATAFVGLATVFAWVDGLSVLTGGQAVQGFVVALPGFGSELTVSLDALGAGFLVIITGVSLLSTIYSVGYMEHYKKESSRRFYSLLQLFIAGMIGVVSVSDWLFFIVFWELMTLASYFLVTFERSDARAVRAGFKYFIMTHIATAGLLVGAVVLWSGTGDFSFGAHKAALGMVSPVLKASLLALYLLAFSTKAGIFPMGDWLPDAHPAAPSGVSAILSGVMIKLGAYGVLRVFWGMLPEISARSEMMAWGTVIAFLGTVSAFVGGMTAIRENDAKRLLAFSSISQTGYIFLALGIAIAFSGSGALAALSVLALLAAGFHILNDAIYKSLLFMNAGSIIYSTGTHDLNKVGGLASVMPIAAAAGLIGVASVSGLPPTNGFASKWLIYQSSISGGLEYAPFLAVAVVAFFVSLSTLAYSLKYFNTAFLGMPSARPRKPTPLPGSMTFAQVVLAVMCILVGLAPAVVIRSIASVYGASSSLLFGDIGAGGIAIVATDVLVPATWSPVILFVTLIVAFVIAEAIRGPGRAQRRSVPSWYGGEEHTEDEVRYRAQGFYSPFNEAFARVYPHLPTPSMPSLGSLRTVLDFDSWLHAPLLRWGGNAIDRISKSHVGVPQLYMVWQVAGMIIVILVLFALVR